jgi:aminoglycoside 6'-N-acetyltransferase I
MPEQPHIEKCGADSLPHWVTLRFALWPEEDKAVMAAEAPAILADPDRLVLVARAGDTITGFAEAAIRRDYVNGCETSPVAFLEGIHVAPEHRRRGIARALIKGVEEWAHQKGLKEMASDALEENSRSHAMHAALGFDQTERVIFFRKSLR